jgi:hypothetical protein
MAAEPLSRIVLGAGSVADDLTYVALADISRLLDGQTTDYRVIGGLPLRFRICRVPRVRIFRRRSPAGAGSRVLGNEAWIG